MLFISDNKKIDLVIKKLQPKLKLKINIERDFDCGLNDVFEKRPDVVFIQSQIAGVTGVSVARHIQLLLGETAPKFILIHDGDAKAKPIKGLYEHLVDLSQDEETVAADILEKLNVLLGQQWQYIFATSVFDGADYDAFTPAPEAPRDHFSPCLFEDVPDSEPVTPGSAQPVPQLLAMPEIAVADAFEFISSTDAQRAEMFFKECREPAKEESAAGDGNVSVGEVKPLPETDIQLLDIEQYVALPAVSMLDDVPALVVAEKAELSNPAAVEPSAGLQKPETANSAVSTSTVVTEQTVSPVQQTPPSLKTLHPEQVRDLPVTAAKVQRQPLVETAVVAEKPKTAKPAVAKSTAVAEQPSPPVRHSSVPLKAVPAAQNQDIPAAATCFDADSVHAALSPLADCGMSGEDVPPVLAPEKREWAFDGEPSLKKSSWKWYQVVELLLVIVLLVGGWYVLKQKSQTPVSSAMNAIMPAATAPVAGGQKTSAAASPGALELPSFIPLMGLEPSYAAENPGWDRYVDNETEFRVFRADGRLKALQVMAAKGHSISEPQLKRMLVELTGTGDYSVTSREEKQGFQVSHAVVKDKAELLVYNKNSTVYAVVVSLN